MRIIAVREFMRFLGELEGMGMGVVGGRGSSLARMARMGARGRRRRRGGALAEQQRRISRLRVSSSERISSQLGFSRKSTK